MGLINQPMSQIRLTNVSLVRMKKGRKRFEIACYQNKVQDWRLKVEKDLDEVLQIPQVFTNVLKGQVANNEDLKESFGTIDQDEIIQEILAKGEIQLNEKERLANLQQKQNEFLTIISTKCINPRLKKRYSVSIIQKVLNELKFNLNPNKPPKTQALEAIKLLVENQMIPIARAQMKVRAIVAVAYKLLYEDDVLPLIDHVEEEHNGAKRFEVVGIIDPINYKKLGEAIGAKGALEVLDMAAIKD